MVKWPLQSLRFRLHIYFKVMLRYEFWNGHLDKGGQHVKTKHNPCLWSNIGVDANPWRGVHVEATAAVDKWRSGVLTPDEFLHHLRFVAYGLGKRDFDDAAVVWPGNLTHAHRPRLACEVDGARFTYEFQWSDGSWHVTRVENAEFRWPLLDEPAGAAAAGWFPYAGNTGAVVAAGIQFNSSRRYDEAVIVNGLRWNMDPRKEGAIPDGAYYPSPDPSRVTLF